MAQKSETAFEEGGFVVYPYGVGRILGTEEREIAVQSYRCWLYDSTGPDDIAGADGKS